MTKTEARHRIALTVLTAALAAHGSLYAQAPSPAPTVALPTIPAPVAVTLDARTSALLVLDISTLLCQPRPACAATVPAIATLLKKARDAKVPVIYSSTMSPKGPAPILADVAPQPGEPTVIARANKFIDTNLEDLLKQRKATTLVVVGTVANGAVLYTSFHANVKGFTVVVAEDGISSPVPFDIFLARYQLLNQPGFTNSANKPLAERLVTLSRGDLISFR